LYALFGTSRQLVVAGTSASAVLLFSTVTALHPKDSAHYAALAAALVLATGAFFIVAGLCRLGFITQFLSRPVMEGFVFGLAIFVTISQLPKLFGLEKGEGDSIRQLAHVIANLGQTSMSTLAVGALSLAALFALERWAPKLPGGLLVLAVAIIVSWSLNLSHHGVATVGHIPTGLPSVSLPHVKAADFWALIPSAAGMMLVIFSEALGAGQTFADTHRYRLDPGNGGDRPGQRRLGVPAWPGRRRQPVPDCGQRRRRRPQPVVEHGRSSPIPDHCACADSAVHRSAGSRAGGVDHSRGVAPDEGG
jgi:MFS superfamily sulfate permease-like transporter